MKLSAHPEVTGVLQKDTYDTMLLSDFSITQSFGQRSLRNNIPVFLKKVLRPKPQIINKSESETVSGSSSELPLICHSFILFMPFHVSKSASRSNDVQAARLTRSDDPNLKPMEIVALHSFLWHITFLLFISIGWTHAVCEAVNFVPPQSDPALKVWAPMAGQCLPCLQTCWLLSMESSHGRTWVTDANMLASKTFASAPCFQENTC